MSNGPFSRGSEWRKWDLQVQTRQDANYTCLGNNSLNEVDLQKLITATSLTETEITAQEKEIDTQKYAKLFIKYVELFTDISVLGITDHNTGVEIDALVGEARKSSREITVLPGIEVSSAQGLHILCLFDPEKKWRNNWTDSIDHFLTELGLTNGAFNAQNQPLNSTKTAQEILEITHKKGGLCIFAHIGTDNGLFKFSNIASGGNAHISVYKNNLCQIVQLPRSGNLTVGVQNIIDGKDPQYGNKSVTKIKCSDARKLTEIGSYFSWIKADPTFEGLKQIIYEPNERVCLKDANPSYNFDKPHFESLNIRNKIAVFDSEEDQVYFQKAQIPLNKSMVTVIGGRGSGKSLLIDYLAATFGEGSDKRESTFTSSGDFEITYAKNNKPNPETVSCTASGKNYLDFLFIPQGKLKSIINSGSLNKEIKSLLGLEDLSFSEQITKEIEAVLQDIEAVHEWFDQTDEFGVKIHNEEVVKQEKQKNEKLLESITTKENEDSLKTYSVNVDKIQALETDKSSLIGLKENITSDIAKLNEFIAPLEKYKIPRFECSKQMSAIEIAIQDIDLFIKQANDENDRIKEKFKTIYTGDLSKLLKNVEVYRKTIKNADLRLEQITIQGNKFATLIKKRAELGVSIKNELERQCALITDRWNKIFDQFETTDQKDIVKKILSDRAIVVKGEIVFDKDKFYELLAERLNLTYFKPPRGIPQRQKVMEWMQVSDVGSFVKFIKEKLHSQYKDEEQRKKWLNGTNPSELFFDLDIRSQYLHTQASITYGSKPINKLSAGQRGTMFLCLQLAQKAFSAPIIFDQPEDDLDNEFIVKDLIDIFKTLKRYRQIIIVTHNANLVVNADAEQVIVASNSDELLSYFSGALECPEINESVCRVLEGGKDAFERRKNKYQM